MKKQSIGSHFDEFLAEQGILEEVEEVAVKRVLALQIAEAMKKQNLTKVDMARMMDTSRAVIDRLLDPDNNSVTLKTMTRAAQTIGKRLRLVLD